MDNLPVMKVLVASLNPVKIAATKAAFSEYFENVIVEGIQIDSGVSHQPLNEEILAGAKTRARELWEHNRMHQLNADFCVGIEGGLLELYSATVFISAICVVDKEGKESLSLSPGFPLPHSVLPQLRNRVTLGEVFDKIIGQQNTGQKQGAIGFLTKGKMERTQLHKAGVLMVLAPFLNRELYFEK